MVALFRTASIFCMPKLFDCFGVSMEHAIFFLFEFGKSNNSPSTVGFIRVPLQPSVLSTLLDTQESKIIELL
jgi:hypothetical protein